jgi:hypothetical protein
MSARQRLQIGLAGDFRRRQYFRAARGSLIPLPPELGPRLSPTRTRGRLIFGPTREAGMSEAKADEVDRLREALSRLYAVVIDQNRRGASWHRELFGELMAALALARVELEPPVGTLAAGQTWRIYFDAGNPNNRTIHIRAVLDGAYIVFRAWSKRKQSWSYAIEPTCYFDFLLREGHLRSVRFLKPNESSPAV